MSIAVKERAESRRGSHENERPWCELVYTVKGTADQTLAYQAVLGLDLPEIEWAGPDGPITLPRRGIQLDPQMVNEGVDTGVWTVVVRYEFARGGSSGEPDNPPWAGFVSLDTGGGTMRLTQSIKTMARVARTGADKPAPDYKGAIGVTKDGVEGVDVAVPMLGFTEKHRRPVFTADYARIIFETTHHWNVAPFRVFEACECLLLPVAVNWPVEGQWEFTYSFSCQPNRTAAGENPMTMPGFPDFDKRGWDYLWVHHEDEKDDAAKTTVLRPTAAYVEQVFYSADFSRLGIGT